MVPMDRVCAGGAARFIHPHSHFSYFFSQKSLTNTLSLKQRVKTGMCVPHAHAHARMVHGGGRQAGDYGRNSGRRYGAVFEMVGTCADRGRGWGTWAHRTVLTAVWDHADGDWCGPPHCLDEGGHGTPDQVAMMY